MYQTVLVALTGRLSTFVDAQIEAIKKSASQSCNAAAINSDSDLEKFVNDRVRLREYKLHAEVNLRVTLLDMVDIVALARAAISFRRDLSAAEHIALRAALLAIGEWRPVMLRGHVKAELRSVTLSFDGPIEAFLERLLVRPTTPCRGFQLTKLSWANIQGEEGSLRTVDVSVSVEWDEVASADDFPSVMTAAEALSVRFEHAVQPLPPTQYRLVYLDISNEQAE